MKSGIRVIKKVDRVARPSAKAKRRKQEPKRDAISTIKGWVQELNAGRTPDAKTAFNSLFNDGLTGVTES